MAKRPRSNCPYCGKSVAFKNDGTFRQHGYRNAAWHGNVGEYCEGGGMTAIQFLHNAEVTLVDHMGSDASIVAAARVSVVGEAATADVDIDEYKGLINYLAKHRHGTPFEHTAICMRIHAPIFVFREWHRHRVPWSYNEESGRYKQLEPIFHIPGPERPLQNVGTSARPVMAPASLEVYTKLVARMKHQYENAYKAYIDSLSQGVAKEVAREVLPVGIFSTMYATANLRGWMNFLSLRVNDPNATFPSFPQYEIQYAAMQCEKFIKELFPIAHKAFIDNGRVAP